MNKNAIKQLLQQFYQEKSKIAFNAAFNVDTSDNLDDNIKAMSDAYAKVMADQSEDLFAIIDKHIDAKLANANIQLALIAPPSGGAVTGKIIITGT